MSIEEEIRKIVNEELDRRIREENLHKFIEEAQPISFRSLREGKWDFNEVAMPEPEVPWQQRHDRKTHVSETPFGDVEVTTVPENRCRWCNEPIALEVNPYNPDDFWWHLRTDLQSCEGFNQIAEPKEERDNDRPRNL